MGLRRGDLEDQVLPMISFDEYESNFGETALTVAFFIHGKDAATDFNKFLQKSHVNYLTTDISSAQDKDGYYTIYIEFKIDDKIIDNFMDIIYEIESLTMIDSWQIHLNNRELIPLVKDSLEYYVNSKYKKIINPEQLDEGVIRPSLNDMISIGVIDPNSEHKVIAYRNMNIDDLKMTEDHSYTIQGVDKVERLAKTIPNNIKAIVVNQNNEILDGHHRYRAARDYLKWKTIPCVVIQIDLLSENKLMEDGNISFENQQTGYDAGTQIYTLNAFDGDTSVGEIIYGIKDDEVSIIDITGRNGRELLLRLQGMFPENELDTSKLIGSSLAVIKSVKTEKKPVQDIINGIKRVENITKILNKYQKMNSKNSDWAELSNELNTLNDFLYGKKPYKTMFVG